MIDNKNKIGDIKSSNIGKIEQVNIEKQENNTIINKNEIKITSANNNFIDMTLSHSLFPDFIVDIKKMHDGKYALVSKATRKESTLKYPVNFKSSFTVTDERYKGIKDQKVLLDMLQYADSPVEIKVTKFEQYLGDVIDPYPNPELSPMQEGVKTYILPHKKELPKVFFNVEICFKNCDFKLTDINLKLTKQISSNKFIFDNYEQTLKSVFIQLEVEDNDGKIKCNLNYKINPIMQSQSNAVYEFNQFVLNLITKPYSMYDLEKQKTIMSGKNTKNYETKKIKGLEQYISILKKIITIEEYFNIKFEIPNTIEDDDILTINKLYKYISDSRERIKATDIRFSVIKGQSEIERLKQLVYMERTSIMTVSEDVVFNILGIDIKVKKITEKYDDIKCSNIQELTEIINNYESLNDNYEIRIIMISAKGKYFYKETEVIK